MIQRGENNKYPMEIETWKFGEKIPEWLSDRANVKFIDGEGNITLNTRDLNNNGREIISSDGVNTLIRLNTADSYVCFSKSHPLISLRPIQLELLYVEKEK